MEHSWAGPPGWRRRETARVSAAEEALAIGLHRRAPGLALRPGPPVPFPQPGEPAGERGKAGACVPRAALEGAPAAGWREGGQVRRAQDQAWSLRDLLRAPLISLAETPESWRGLGDPPP